MHDTDCHGRRHCTTMRRGIRWLGLAPLLTGCVDRLIVPSVCGDTEPEPGEVCFEDDHETIEIPFEPLAIRVAPFDGDAFSDILVTGLDGGGAVIGSFSLTQPDGALGPLLPTALYGCTGYPGVGDVGDGSVADLLFDDCDDTMLVFRGVADGTIQGPTVVDLDVLTLGSALLDGDGDGIGDVIALGTNGDTVAISLARGIATGGYLAPILTIVGTASASDAPRSFSIGFVDGDTRFDLILSHADPTLPPTFVRGIVEGFGPPEPWDVIGPASSVSYANTDGEGDPELVVFRKDPAAVEVWSGGLGSARRIGGTKIAALGDSSFSAGDFDADRNLDLALFRSDEAEVVLWLGDGKGGWRKDDTVRFGSAVKQLSVGDLDADGLADLVAGTFAERTLTVVRGAPH